MPTQTSLDSKLAKQGRSPLRPERPATEYAIMALLLEGASHGYELTRQFATRHELRQVCRLEMAMLYSLLRKLEKDGTISGREEPVTEHKVRRVVELTAQGRTDVEEWLARPVRHSREIRFDFLIKLYFAYQRSPQFAIALMEQQLKYNESLLELLQSQKDSLTERTADDFEHWVLDFRIEQNDGILHWLKQCQTQLHAKIPNLANQLS